MKIVWAIAHESTSPRVRPPSSASMAERRDARRPGPSCRPAARASPSGRPPARRSTNGPVVFVVLTSAQFARQAARVTGAPSTRERPRQADDRAAARGRGEADLDRRVRRSPRPAPSLGPTVSAFATTTMSIGAGGLSPAVTISVLVPGCAFRECSVSQCFCCAPARSSVIDAVDEALVGHAARPCRRARRRCRTCRVPTRASASSGTCSNVDGDQLDRVDRAGADQLAIEERVVVRVDDAQVVRAARRARTVTTEPLVAVDRDAERAGRLGLERQVERDQRRRRRGRTGARSPACRRSRWPRGRTQVERVDEIVADEVRGRSA